MNALACGLAASIALATAAHASGTVTPSGDTVPENLLRIELHLERPLPHPLALDRVRLLDTTGAPISDAFLDLPLPGDDGRTITLLLHPGRVKTGVGPNLALGRALHAGEDVTLVVDDPQMPAPLRKRWHVSEALTRRLFVGDWRLELPHADSRAPLRVWLNLPLTATSARLIALRGPEGDRLPGAVSLRSGETAWEFRPARPWRAGSYALVVHPLLEDVAGNRPCAPFEAVGLSVAECAAEERRFELRR